MFTTAPAAHNSDTQSNENLEDNMADIRERLLQWREDNRRDLIGLAPAVSCEPAPDTASAANTSSGSQKPKVYFAAAVVKYCGASCTGMGSKRSTAASDELVMCDHCGEPIPTFRNDQLEIRRLLKHGKCKEACEQRTSCLYELCYGIITGSACVFPVAHEMFQCIRALPQGAAPDIACRIKRGGEDEETV